MEEIKNSREYTYYISGYYNTITSASQHPSAIQLTKLLEGNNTYFYSLGTCHALNRNPPIGPTRFNDSISSIKNQ